MYEKAKEIFEAGLRRFFPLFPFFLFLLDSQNCRKATPYNRLDRHYREFLVRMEKNSKDTKEEETTREPLSDLKKKRKGSGLRERKEGSSLSSMQNSGSGIAENGDNFQIFEDDGEGGEGEGGDMEQFKRVKELSFLWSSLPTEKEKEKENTLVPSSWRGVKVSFLLIHFCFLLFSFSFLKIPFVRSHKTKQFRRGLEKLIL